MATKKKSMTVKKMQEIWESPYGKGKLPDFSELIPHIHPNCHFQDSIQSAQGRDKFVEICERLGKRCSELVIEVHNAGKNENVFFIEWTMSMSIMGSPMTHMKGITRLVVDDDGLITFWRDYYDLWGDTFDAIPLIGKLYRLFVQTVMG